MADWKGFLKPKKEKIAIFVVLFIILLALSMFPLPENIGFQGIVLYVYAFQLALHNLLANPAMIFIQLIVSYVIACIFVYVYRGTDLGTIKPMISLLLIIFFVGGNYYISHIGQIHTSGERNFIIPPNGVTCEGVDGLNQISIRVRNTLDQYTLAGSDFIVKDIRGFSKTYVIQDSEIPPIDPETIGMIITYCGDGCESGQNNIKLSTGYATVSYTIVCP